MPPLSLLLSLTAAALLLSPAATTPNHHPCFPSNHTTPCPPFLSPPSLFPFSSSPPSLGCGHPSFQIHCHSPHSLLSINSLPFLLLSHPSPTSLILTPSLPISRSHCPSLPSHPINLSSSPLRLSPDPCPLLSSVPPSNLSSLPTGCHLNYFQSHLLSDPLLLFPHCSSSSFLHLPPNSSASLLSLLRSGFRVEWIPTSDPYFTHCSSCNASGVCGFNASEPSHPFLCFNQLNLTSDPPRPARRLLLFLAAGSFLLLLVFFAAAALRRHGLQSSLPLNHQPTSCSLQQLYSYDELASSTAGFDPRRKIGDGGFGSVYLAHLPPDGRLAAVKRLHHPSTAKKSFYTEIQILSSLRHPHLVRLLAYCSDPRALLLVYDYVPNGTLADHLHRPRHHFLPWPLRLAVAVQTAAALEYLHFALDPPVVHRDVTSSNLFVDRDMRIKLGDFGLSRLLSNNSVDDSSAEFVCCTGPQGTPGYLDPEYHRSFRLTEKSDVYSFGVVLFELVTGMRAVDPRRDRREVALADLVVGRIQLGMLHQVLDPVLVRQGENVASMEAVAELAFRCVAGDKDDRPDARELVAELKRIQGLVHDAVAAAGKG